MRRVSQVQASRSADQSQPDGKYKNYFLHDLHGGPEMNKQATGCARVLHLFTEAPALNLAA